MSVEPLISLYSEGSTAITRSRLILAKSLMQPLCMNNHRRWRYGWQLVCCTGDPIAARMWAKNSGDRTWAVISLRFWSFHAGSMLRNTAGVGSLLYQPIPTPSPLVGSAPSCELRLWSISEWLGVYSAS